MLKTSLSPDAVYVAGDFATDANDLLNRYRVMFERDFSIKSRRFKCFIDLRLSLECLLKAAVAYFGDHGRDRQTVIREVERLGHRIDRLMEVAQPHISEPLRERLAPFTGKMHELPVDLRYALDGYDFRDAKEEFYYETIGSDVWMDTLYGVLKVLQDEIGTHLASHSGIVSSAAIFEALMKGDTYNKYKKK